MKITTTTCRAVLLVFVAMAMLAPSAQAEDGKDNYRKLVYRWHRERDDTVKRVVHSWLRGATPESLKTDILQVINLDVRLANENVQLYVPAFRDPNDLNMSVADLVHRYLSYIGVVTDTAEFFKGKTFKVIKEERPLQAGGSTQAMAFTKWEKK